MGGGGGQGGCERRIEVFVKIQKKNWGVRGGVRGGEGGGRVGRVRVDVIEELKFWGKFTQKNFRGGGVSLGGGSRGGGGGGVVVKIQKKKKLLGGGGGGRFWGGVRVDVNEELKFL